MKSRKLKKLPNSEKCWYCGETAEDVDHKLPQSRGGYSSLENLVPACRKCNNAKGSKTVEEFREFLKLRHAKHSTKYTVVKVAQCEFVFYGERIDAPSKG